MSSRRGIASSLQIFTVLAFFAAGLFFICLPHLPLLRIQVAGLLLNQFEVCTPIGCGFFFATFVLLIGFYGLNRGRYLRISMGDHAALVDAKVIRSALEECFRARFPKQIALSDLEVLRGKKLEISVSLTPMQEDLREALFIQAEKELTALLRERFGYSKPFHLTVRSP